VVTHYSNGGNGTKDKYGETFKPKQVSQEWTPPRISTRIVVTVIKETEERVNTGNGSIGG
jgi:hypothetical protein